MTAIGKPERVIQVQPLELPKPLRKGTLIEPFKVPVKEPAILPEREKPVERERKR